ncbi:hypothetical protein [Burkholderia cepacia]|uniref:hypothetical protein n=1 Tax=Burkholderia cepacia TaxID=292 RepID=UPI000A9A8360|nr:hypothetical protein [Burkholderia cepacia]
MTFIETLEKMAKGAAAGVVVVTALPIFGPVGAITATGAAVASGMGAAAALIDELLEDD